MWMGLMASSTQSRGSQQPLHVVSGNCASPCESCGNHKSPSCEEPRSMTSFPQQQSVELLYKIIATLFSKLSVLIKIYNPKLTSGFQKVLKEPECT